MHCVNSVTHQCCQSTWLIAACHCGRLTCKEKIFSPPKTKRSRSGLPRKTVINVFSLGIPTPPANEGGIYHPRCRGRCREDSDPSVWEQFTFFSLIVPEKACQLQRKASERRAAGGKHNMGLFSVKPTPNSNQRPVIHGYRLMFFFLNRLKRYEKSRVLLV